jgi:hypothetical protein
MTVMVAAGLAAGFEFFARAHQKSLATATHATSLWYPSLAPTNAHKKARPDFSGAGCQVQGKLGDLEN